MPKLLNSPPAADMPAKKIRIGTLCHVCQEDFVVRRMRSDILACPSCGSVTIPKCISDADARRIEALLNGSSDVIQGPLLRGSMVMAKSMDRLSESINRLSNVIQGGGNFQDGVKLAHAAPPSKSARRRQA